MTNSALAAAVLTVAALALPSQGSARAGVPLVPTALVEEVKSASAAVEFMDYVGAGQVIKLEPSDVLVLSYLKSCEHETITGGTVRVGSEKSEVDGGKLVRRKVPCSGGSMKLSQQQANASGASSYRLQNAHFEPTVYALPPVIQIPKLRSGDGRTIIIERTNHPSECFALEIDESLARRRLLRPRQNGRAAAARRAVHGHAWKPQGHLQGRRQSQDRQDAGHQPAAALPAGLSRRAPS